MTLAIFDLDNTLLSGDSDYAWGEFLVTKNVVDAEYHMRTNAKHLADYRAGKLDVQSFIEFQLEPLRINPRRLMEEIRSEFLTEIIIPMITDNARQLVAEHRSHGHTLMIITATNSFITGPIAETLGIDTLIATEVEEINGNFTGRSVGTPSFGPGKVTRLNSWLERGNESLHGSWFYSDSHNDLPLLRIVDNPVALNPDSILRREAVRSNWRIIEW